MRKVAASILVGSIGLCSVAYSQEAQQSPPAAKADAAPATAVNLQVTVLRLGLNEQHKLGSKKTLDELKSTVSESGIYGLQDLLASEGELTLMAKGEQPGTEGEPISAFIGTETPFVTTFKGDAAGGKQTTTTQSSVSGGTRSLITLTKNGESDWKAHYKVDFDAADIRETGGQQLVGRTRIGWDGTGVVSHAAPVLVGRFAREDGKGPAEYIFIYKIEKAAAK